MKHLLLLVLLVGCEKNVEDTFVDDPIHHAKVPICVSIDDGVNREVVKSAMSRWNGDVGCKVFDFCEPAVVHIEHDAPPAGTHCAWRCDPEFHAACTCVGKTWRVFYPNPSTIDVDLWVITHEFCHVLSLKHDRGRRIGICRDESIVNAVSEGIPLLVTDADRKAVREQYCGR